MEIVLERKVLMFFLAYGVVNLSGSLSCRVLLVYVYLLWLELPRFAITLQHTQN